MGQLSCCIRMVHGLLQDRQREFFIQRTADQESAAQDQTGQTSSEPASTAWDDSRQDAYDAAEWHNGFQVNLQCTAMDPCAHCRQGSLQRSFLVCAAAGIHNSPNVASQSHCACSLAMSGSLAHCLYTVNSDSAAFGMLSVGPAFCNASLVLPYWQCGLYIIPSMRIILCSLWQQGAA